MDRRQFVQGFTGSDSFPEQECCSAYMFDGVERCAAGRNLFLDGNSFDRGSPNVDKNSFVGDARLGMAMTIGAVCQSISGSDLRCTSPLPWPTTQRIPSYRVAGRGSGWFDLPRKCSSQYPCFQKPGIRGARTTGLWMPDPCCSNLAVWPHDLVCV